MTTVTEIAETPWYHGGNINAARRLFPEAPEPWIDLSTGINPIPYPVGDIAHSAWSRLPEPSDIAELEAAARGAYGAGRRADIVAAPGTQAIIQWLPSLFLARRVGILGMTYGEHERCWRAGGADIVAAQELSELEACDAAVIVNPNNPDGRILEPERLAALAETFSGHGKLLVVDEAFMDVLPADKSLVPLLPDAGAIVLRSFGKTYGLAGLRLGFAIAPPNIAERLRLALGPWAISGPAIQIGQTALTDNPWLSATIGRLNDDALRLDRLLVRAGFSVIGGTPLFRFAEHREGSAWFGILARAGILTRPFPARPSALRFGIPSTRSAWDRFETALLTAPARL